MNVTSQTISYGFLDESPTLSRPVRYFIIALITTSNPHAASFRRILKRARRRLGKTRRVLGELKFDKSDERTRRFVLGELSKHSEIEVAVTVVDKVGRQVPDNPEHYGMVVGQAAVDFMKRLPRFDLTVDKRYTNPKQETQFRRTVLRIATTVTGAAFGLTTLQSEREPLLQLADFAAGVFHRKYNFGDTWFADLIAGRVVSEKVYEWPTLKDTWREK